MKIHMNTGGLAETNAYLVFDETSKIGAIIDAPEATTAELIEQAKTHGIDVQYLLLTHGHWDHLSDHAVVIEAFPKAKLLMHKLDEHKLQKPGSAVFDLPYEIPPRDPDAHFESGDKIHIGQVVLTVMHTPGHSPGHVCFYDAENHVLFAGDLLMAGSVGRYDFPDCSLEELKASLRRVMALPEQTHVLSGHGPATTIGNEKNGNPFIRQWHLAHE